MTTAASCEMFSGYLSKHQDDDYIWSSTTPVRFVNLGISNDDTLLDEGGGKETSSIDLTF